MSARREKREYWIYRIIYRLIDTLPRPHILFLGRLAGLLFFVFDAHHRRLALRNLKIAFMEKRPLSERQNLARRSFIHFGTTLFDILKLSQSRPESVRRLFRISGVEYLTQALSRGKGVILFSAHFGNWESPGAALSGFGPLKAIARRLDNPTLEKELSEIRAHFGAEVIDKQRATKPVLKALKENAMVVILMDQNVLRSQAVFVDFFGKPAATTPGPAFFAIRSGAALLPAFCVPDQNRTYSVEIFPPMPVPDEKTDADRLTSITQACTKVIEDRIRKNPEYWLWFHNRWKSRP